MNGELGYSYIISIGFHHYESRLGTLLPKLKKVFYECKLPSEKKN